MPVLPNRNSISLGQGSIVRGIIVSLLSFSAVFIATRSDVVQRKDETTGIMVLGITAILLFMTLAYHQLLRIENHRIAEAEAAARENLIQQAFHEQAMINSVPGSVKT